MLRKIFQPFYTAYVIITFTVSILAAFPFFLLFSIGGNHRGRYIIYSVIKYWAEGWMFIIGMPVTRQGPRPQPGRYVVVANHISYMDTLVIFPAIPGYFRPLGKKEISRIPIVGFIYRQIVIMVDRSSTHSRARSLRLLWRVLHREGNIIIFPEGTFNETPDVLRPLYDGAFRLAINTQKPILPLLLPDTFHRWHYSAWWKLWPGRNRVVYLPAIDVVGMTMDDLPALKEKVFGAMAEGLEQLGYRKG
jgi:1-acyl-sn-glycerol-3-phosphate acyltransferase